MTALATVRRTLRLLISIDRRSVLLSFVAGAGSAAITGVVFWIARAVLRSFGEDQGLSVTFGVALAVALLAQIVLQGGRSLAGTLLRQKVAYRVNTEILGRLRSVPYKDFEDNRFQSDYGLLVREAALRPGELVDDIIRTTESALTVLVLLASMMYLSWPISFGFLLLIGPVIWLERGLRWRLLDLQTSSSPDLLRMQYLSQMSIDALWQRDLRVHDSDVIETEYERLGSRYLDRLVAVSRSIELRRLLVGGAGALVVMGVIVAIERLVARDTLSVAEGGTLLLGAYLIFNESRSLASSVGRGLLNLDYARRLFTFIEAFEAPGPPAPSGGSYEAGRIEHIAIDGLCFTYPGADVPALRDVSLELGPGVTAVIGANGAGKTTLVKILSGLIPPSSGRVGLKWEDGSTTGLDAIERSVLFQAPTQFRLTVAQCVTMRSTIDASEEARVRQVLSDVGLSEVIERLPDGLDTVVGGGFGGVADLSGGQWQRLALARLLYGDSPLIILDEPATHLDAAGEAQLLDRLLGLSSDRIVLIVTHRGETIQTCDRVVELSDGHVVGEGAVPAVGWFATRGGRAFLSPAGHSASAPRDRIDDSTP